jgi:hypothetical protein
VSRWTWNGYAGRLVTKIAEISQQHNLASVGRGRVMQSITLKYGRQTRKFVLEKPPFAKVGDTVTFKGEGAEWTVSKIKELDPDATFHITFPKKVTR